MMETFTVLIVSFRPLSGARANVTQQLLHDEMEQGQQQ